MTAVLIEMVLSALRELSNVEYQSRVWTGRDPGGEMSSFEECVASLFDDSNLNLALDAALLFCELVKPGEMADHVAMQDLTPRDQASVERRIDAFDG